tara:strand:+ start:3276 stop:5183 length:1908 start_codon:yes stop_codon:yes gene_type:complete
MGAMKSLAYDYAIYLQKQAQDEDNLDFNIDKIFRQIVDGEIEIPQSYVDMWVSRNSVFASENVVFDAETNSWKQQKRDAKGRFIKGFSDKTEAQLNQEYDEKEEELQAYLEYANDEYIYNEMIAPYYQYGDLDQDKQMSANEFSDFLSQAIMNDNFPEKLTDIYYFQYLQKVAESVPFEVLEKLHDIMEMQLNIGQVSGDKDIEILGGRGVFITDILLNLKQGQEMWSAETFEAEKCKCNNYTPDFNREKPMDASWSKIGQIESYEWDDEDDEQAVIVPITCDDCGRKGETVYLYGYNEYDDSNLKWFEAETFESDPEEWKQSGFNHHGDLPFKEMDKIYKDNRKQRKYNMNHPKDGSKVPLSRRDYWELFEDDTVDDGGDLLMVEALYEDKSSRNKFYGLTFYFDLTNHTSPYKINPNDENSYRWDYSNFNFDPVNPRGYASLIISDGNEEGRIISSHRFKEMNAETFESPATVNNFWANCHDGKFGVLGRKIYYNCRLFASISTGAAVVSNPVGFYADGRSKLRYSSRLSKSNSPEVEIVKSLSNKEQPSSVEDWYNLFDKANMELNKQFQAETEEIAYSDAEINLMRYDIVEHELENSDYNFLYDVLLYGTPGWANYTDEEVVRHFRNIFER